MNFPIQYYFVALSVVAAIISLIKKEMYGYLKLFPFFLCITLIVEIGAWWLTENNINTIVFFNFFSLFEFVFYMYVLKNIILSPRIKTVISITIIIYSALALINIFFIQKMYTFHTLTYSIGCLLIVLISIYYFFELFKSPSAVNLKKEPAFWIVTGLLFFYTCTLPFFGLANYIYRVLPVLARNFEAILSMLNVLLYSLFTVAFLCRIKMRKYIL